MLQDTLSVLTGNGLLLQEEMWERIRYVEVRQDRAREISNQLVNPVSAIRKKKLRGLSPRANYTDRAAAAGRRS